MIAPDGGGTACVVPGGATRCTSEVIVMGATNGNQTKKADKTPANPRKEIATSLRNLLANTAPLLLLVQQHLIHQ